MNLNTSHHHSTENVYIIKRVADLTNPGGVFDSQIAAKIQAIPISQLASRNRIVQPNSNSRVCSIKSAYQSATIEACNIEERRSSSSYHVHCKVLKMI
ncbi:hypothetical protein CsSME_00002362 [Camellia sinensis var. sinensis]